jgi:hypothetical protein
MSEELLEVIIEKLENLEKRIHALEEKIDSVTNHSEDFRAIRRDMREIRMEIKSIPSQISIPVDEIKETTVTMSALKDQLKQPLIQKIKTIHYLSKPLFLSVGLMILVVGLITWLVLEKNRESVMEINDIKYRGVRLWANGEFLHAVDSLFLVDPDRFRKKVEQEEQQTKELPEKTESNTKLTHDKKITTLKTKRIYNLNGDTVKSKIKNETPKKIQ